ncbi:hypothetical protein B9Z55_024348 [Caenorhabditis nigoni]|uniref:Uncharacterized protein n=1 Tax=Caenorhabditis nigoni TaxID=1611254 RepID=A0A2G5STK4_9PELO|nr:hypothetical protein B9Z55_024348 [Caenorhabditis nigoni]
MQQSTNILLWCIVPRHEPMRCGVFVRDVKIVFKNEKRIGKSDSSSTKQGSMDVRLHANLTLFSQEVLHTSLTINFAKQ